MSLFTYRDERDDEAFAQAERARIEQLTTEAYAQGLRAGQEIGAEPTPKWSHEPPTVPGWYWLRSHGNRNGCPVSVFARLADGALCIRADDGAFPVARYTELHGAEWCGPLEEPK